jgi:hypothetical protein
MSTVIQRSFAGGEIAPALYARVDISKYQTGLRTLRNYFVMRHGGATNRPGTKFIGEVDDSSKVSRLIPFIFSTSVTYILEFANKKVRFIKNGSYIFETAQNISGITAADPAVITTSGTHGYSTGDEIAVAGITGMTELNGRNFKITVLSTTTFSIQDNAGTDIDSSAYTAYASGGTVAKVYEVDTVYAEDQLFDVQYIQSADVMTLVHPYYPPKELSRTADTSWTFTDITITPAISAPSISGSSGGPAGSDTFTYVVTAIAEDSLEESLASTSHTSASIGTPTAADPLTISFSSVTGAQEYNVYRRSNNIFYLLGVSGGSSFDDIGQEVDTTITPPINSVPFVVTSSTITGITQASPGVVTYSGSDVWSNGDDIVITGVSGMTEVNSLRYIVANVNTGANTFELTDADGNNVDTSAFTAYSSGGTATEIGAYPSTVTYYQQRLAFANSDDFPEKIWTSKIGQFKNFTKSSPIQADDAITFQIAGQRVNEVRHLMDLSQLVVFTESGEWTVGGDDSGILRPTSVNPKQQSYYGANNMQPIPIGKSALYVQARGSIIRDLGYEFSVDGYSGNDLTIFSAHLFDDFGLTDWAYQQIPHSVLWVVRNDGTLLALTYVREQGIVAWSRHDFDGGVVESVSSVPEGDEDAVYVTVKRTIDGLTKRYVERLATRSITDVVDAKFMDSYLTYDGRHTGTTTMTLSGGTNWTYDETLTLTASVATFTSSAFDVGNAVHLTGSDGTVIRCTITAYSSTTVVSVTPQKTVPAAMRSTAISTWSYAVDQVTGLWHLEGEDVSVFADGFVAASPNNASYTTLTVANGTITLDKPYAVVHVGLPYISDIETLNIDSLQGETLTDKFKDVQNVTIFVEETRGMWAGPKPPTSDTTDPLENLTEYKLRNDESYDSPPELKTDSIDVNITSEWNSGGRVFLRQVDPVPCSILAIAPAGYFPFRAGGQ